MIDGYSRFQSFRKVVLPQATTGIAATAIFCLIFSWNEYAFALLLTSGTAQTAPPFIPTIIGEGGLDWPAVAAGATLFLVPIVFFTIMLRKQQQRDEIATQHKEDFNAKKPAREPLAIGVINHHRNNCERTQAVKRWQIRHFRQGVHLRSCRRAVGGRRHCLKYRR